MKNALTVEELAQIARSILERCENEGIDPHSVKAESVVREAVREAGIDERFWYPIHLALHWAFDLNNWADDPEGCLDQDAETENE